MTEMMKNNGTREFLSGPRYALDPVAFAKALILAPLLVAGAGFWIILIPVFAAVFGGPIYLIVGTPVLMVYLHYAEGSAAGAAALAFVTTAVGALGLLAVTSLHDLRPYNDGLIIWILFALAFAPIWGATFGYLYNRWRSPMSRQPLPPLA
ncbi:hypothetical protein [Tateyamaria sp. SN6-1]|uniref:hypothetical protein n=1 Tax=Tateyamaria sp. SN6-1 TaxID=3092148 RepID=UPI0039F4DA59